MIFAPQPVALPGIATFAAGALAFLLAVLFARSRREAADASTQRLSTSVIGMIVQSIGIALAGSGRVLVTLDPLGPAAIGEAAAVALLMGAAVTLFVWAARTMGHNWSIRARTRSDHQLVQEGPFRFVRNPIYSAMLLFLFGLAVAMGHQRQLLVALPVFALGTWLRVRSEEALLRAAFGDAYYRYAAKVKRFVPGLF